MSILRKKILVFLALTLALSSVFYAIVISGSSLNGLTLGLMWCPGLAAILTQLIFNNSLKGLGWGFGKIKYLLLGYGLPVIYSVTVYLVVWLTGLGKFIPDEMARETAAVFNIEIQSPATFLILYILIRSTAGLVMHGFAALGEEIGWRGFLVHELFKGTSFTTASFISGVIWALWHFPIILFSDYNNAGAPLWFGLICFSILAIGVSFAAAWLRLKSNSMWPAVLLHASHNIFIQAYLTPLTADTGLTAFVIDEFGIGLALAAVVTAYIFWRKRVELPLQPGLTPV